MAMILKARFLSEVSSVNSFNWRSAWEFTEGDGPLLYLQLIDASQDLAEDGFKPRGRRYVPAAGATLQLTINSLNNANKVTRFATQPYAQDPSIWSLQLLPADPVRGTAQLLLTLTEGAVIRTGMITPAVYARPKSNLSAQEQVIPVLNSTF